MFKNPLYYFPVEANRLYYAKKGSKEYKKLTAEIAAKTADLYVNDDELFNEYTSKIKRKLTAVFVFAFLGLAAASAMQITDMTGASDLIFALFFCVCMLSCILAIFLSVFVVSLRRKLIQHLLKDYTPVCEEFGEKILREVGILCLDTLGNRDNIEYILEEKEDGQELGELAECVCISCLKPTRNPYNMQFDKNESAICPYCGKKTMIGKAQCMSDAFLQKIHIYASEAEQAGMK